MSVRAFTCLPTIGGYDVVADDTGRPVAHRATHASANGVAFVLNDAARGGPKALVRAFKAVRGTSDPSDPSIASEDWTSESDSLEYNAGVNGLGLDPIAE